MSFDLIAVGGGVAGSSLAARMAGSGARVLLAERDVEIVADRGLERVTAEEWEAVCAAIEQDFSAGRWREGALEGVAGVTQLLAREFPSDGANANEQPNRPHIL